MDLCLMGVTLSRQFYHPNIKRLFGEAADRADAACSDNTKAGSVGAQVSIFKLRGNLGFSLFGAARCVGRFVLQLLG